VRAIVIVALLRYCGSFDVLWFPSWLMLVEGNAKCSPVVDLILLFRIRNCLRQLYAKDITADDKQELDEALQREVKYLHFTT
jgi:hypothetical protein